MLLEASGVSREPDVDRLPDAVVTSRDGRVATRFTIRAPGPSVAVERALGAWADIGLDATRAVRLEVVRSDVLAASNREPVLPVLVGVAEVAGLLGVSRQRVSELARGDAFPDPLVVLAAGPVWAEPAIRRFLETWTRKPGRPRKAPGNVVPLRARDR